MKTFFSFASIFSGHHSHQTHMKDLSISLGQMLFLMNLGSNTQPEDYQTGPH